MNSLLVYIIILNYKNYDDTIHCVRSVENIEYSNYRIVIVDNNSGNGSEEILKKEFPRHLFIQTGSNRGYAAGNNAGIRTALSAGAEYILILNNDTRVSANFLDILVTAAEQDRNAGILGPKVIDETGAVCSSCARRRPTFGDYFWRTGPGRWLWPGNRWIQAHYYRGEYHFDHVRKVDIISGSCMLIRSGLLREIGLLDEGTFLFLEEFILHEKMRRTNYHTLIVPHSIIIHKRHASMEGRKLFPFIAILRSLRYYLAYHRHYRRIATFLALTSVGMYGIAGIVGSRMKRAVTSAIRSAPLGAGKR